MTYSQRIDHYLNLLHVAGNIKHKFIISENKDSDFRNKLISLIKRYPPRIIIVGEIRGKIALIY